MLKHHKIMLAAVWALLGLTLLLAAFTHPEHRLVGLGCGPDHVTMTAMEEDEFPAPCYAVDTPQNLCGLNVNAKDCADYLGDGY